MNQIHDKRDVALVQLRQAIQLYDDEDFICSLTLAGAAEEILGKIAKARSGENALQQDVDFVNEIVESAQNAGLTAAAATPKELISRRNRLRNEAKHAKEEPSGSVSGDFEVAADEMIDRTLRNWSLAFGDYPDDPVIQEYLSRYDH